MKMAVVAGLDSNLEDNALNSILYLLVQNHLPHTSPHIFVHLSLVRLIFSAEKMNILSVFKVRPVQFSKPMETKFGRVLALPDRSKNVEFRIWLGG
jgi:hypothetical protein|tara:strand:- start:132 stop:419 length:288 start_codon:yes stop_codon:yes gene_type:complete